MPDETVVLDQRALQPAKTVADRRRWLEYIQELASRLESIPEATRDDRLARAQMLVFMGLVSRTQGRHEDMLRYLSEAQVQAPNAGNMDQVSQLVGMYESTERATPWDSGNAVGCYDDLEDLVAHQGLPFEQFFLKTRRGAIRKTICQMMCALVKPGERILEVGCAAGGYYASLRGFIDVSRYVAVDWTPGMVRRAKQAFPNLAAARMDVRNIAAGTDAFPVTLSTDVLMHVDAWRQGLQELYRVTSRALVLRVRVHLDAGRPTLVGRVGAGEFRVPYVINNQPEFMEVVNALDPPPVEIMTAPVRPEPMYDGLWQLTDDYPDLLEGHSETDELCIDGVLDVVVLKRRAE